MALSNKKFYIDSFGQGRSIIYNFRKAWITCRTLCNCGTEAVSYTHLDVYKRQLELCQIVENVLNDETRN